MANDTDEECQTAFALEKTRFEILVYISILLTLLSFVAFNCYKEQLVAAPRRSSQLYAVAAVLKILIGILLLSVFSPKCPSGCYCGQYHPSYVYPLIIILVGNIWAYRSKKFYDLSQRGPLTATAGPTEELPKQEQGENELV